MPPRSYAALALLITALVPAPSPAYAAPEAMTPVATVTLPGSGATGPSTLAFDGTVFYYTTGDGSARVERMRLTGSGLALKAVALPPLRLAGAPTRISYDARHRALVTQVIATDLTTTTVARYDLRTGRTRRLFTFADGASAGGAAYDWATDRFVTVTMDGLTMLANTGAKVRSCAWQSDAGTLAGSPSALVSTGAGEIYEQAEDDTSIYRVTLGCATPVTYTHRTITESTWEDDSVLCDAVTFPQPVIWLRDSETATMTAHVLPSGACVLPTALSVIATPSRVCATLGRAEVALPIAGEALSLSVDARTAVPATTDTHGTACTAVDLPAGRHTVAVTYAGTRAWAPAAAHRTLTVSATPALRHVETQRSVPPGKDAVEPPAPDVVPGGVQPGLAPAPGGAGTQAVTQEAYGHAAASQALTGAVPVPEVQRQGNVAYAMSDLGADRRRSQQPAVRLLGIAVISAIATGVATRRATATDPVSAGR